MAIRIVPASGLEKIFLDAAATANPYLRGNKVIADLLSE